MAADAFEVESENHDADAAIRQQRRSKRTESRHGLALCRSIKGVVVGVDRQCPLSWKSPSAAAGNGEARYRMRCGTCTSPV